MTSADDLAQVVRDSAPKVEVKVVVSGSEDGCKEFPLDLRRSRAELGYTPQLSMKKALQDYMEELWGER